MESPLCFDFLSYENYEHRSTCNRRHLLTKANRNMLRKPLHHSWVKIKIINIVSPVHYSVQLLGYRRSEQASWESFNVTDGFYEFQEQLTNFYEKLEFNQKTKYEEIVLGRFYVYKNENMYHRCCVIDKYENE